MSHQILPSLTGTLGQAQAVLVQIQNLNDQMFDLLPNQTRTLFNTYSRSIEGLQTQARTLEERATVSRAREALTLVQEQLAVIAPTETTPQVQPPVRKHFADHNQYDARYAGIHTVATDRNSACTCIAPCAVLSLLRNGRGADLNATIAQGQQMMVHALADQRLNPLMDGEHITFADIAEARFPEMQVVLPHQFDGFGFYPKVLREDNQAVFQEVIDSLLVLKGTHGKESIGCVITSHGESGSIMVLPHPDRPGHNLFVHSDSHGSRELNDNNPNAYLIEFDRAEDAAQFLARRYPFIEDMGDHYNMMNLYPVVLRNEGVVPAPGSADLPQEAPRAEIVPPVIAETQQTISSCTSPASAVNPHLFLAAETLTQMREQVNPLLERADEDADVQILTLVAQLQSSDLRASFKMSSNDPWNVSDRLFFHTYFIHANETPDRIPRDIEDYGRLAFLNFGGVGSEPVERARAIQRTLVEVGLEGLEDAILNNDAERARHYLDSLDRFEVHERDRIENYSRASHSLFAALYQRYNLARETNQSLVSPHDPAFRGDFGRSGFRDEAAPHQIPQAIKLEVIRQIRQQYQQKWRI
ncbi:MAG: hypothetical protein JSR39_00285 [Verrucomicrobia bacterium]|nr:hypothetical protein [Verrucomicrobiota bacterium]